MSFGNSLNLFSQQTGIAAPDLSVPASGPQLGVPWGTFRQSALSSVRTLLSRPLAPKKFPSAGYFRDCWVEGRIPRAALIAAGLWHIVFLLAPWPELPALRKKTALENFQLTWSGPINDLPPLQIAGAVTPVPSARGDVAKPPAPPGADAVHPRQRIFTDPLVPTHPRQTLINAAAPAIPPKLLPSLPNIVQLQTLAMPAKPRMELNEQTLAQLRPREHRIVPAGAVSAPVVAAVAAAPEEITLAPFPNAPARPKLELNAGSAPRLSKQITAAQDTGQAPELAHSNPPASNAATFIALSANPGPVAPPVPPQGNLTARVAVSPEGKQLGAPNTTALASAPANGGANDTPENPGSTTMGTSREKSSTIISISGGNPVPKNISGLGGNPQPKGNASAARGFSAKIDPRSRIADVPDRSGPPNFAALPAGAKPEQVFAAKKTYTLLVNMPNLNSATGSWILNFSELRASSSAPRVTSADLSGPAPIRKSDPKYPSTLINEHVEGEVVLYAVIRADGSVDSVELVRGLDEQLDNNAMQALAQWKFRPASRQGTPVDLEAIVHIPFHAPSDR
ncbi:MAG TPA: energy transducer TonB [Candidatus Acidoferrum sp.]|jgi:protein TonB